VTEAEGFCLTKVAKSRGVTGFGRAGHSREMVVGPKVRDRYWFDRIPHHPEASGAATIVVLDHW
jgi:hypothetical protein